jgi:RNA polymerase sigma factor (sigma-70 family)
MSERGAGLDDSDLLQRFYECDEDALEELLKRWRPIFRRMFASCGIQPNTAEDLIQDLTVRLYLTRERLAINTDGPIGPYLRKMARNLALRELERIRTGPIPVDDIESEIEADSPLSSSVSRDVQIAFAQLPEIEQTYLLLCREHGLGKMSHGEVAAALKTSPQYVSQISKRTLARLRKLLRSQGYRIVEDGKKRKH